MLKVLLISCLCGISYLLPAQEMFSTTQLESFSSIYFQSKNTAADAETALIRLFDGHKISKERYGTLVREAVHGNKSSLSAEEQQFILAIQRLKEETELKKQESLEQLCQANELSYKAYQKILKQYRTDISFQRSLKPFFDQQMKNPR